MTRTPPGWLSTLWPLLIGLTVAAAVPVLVQLQWARSDSVAQAARAMEEGDCEQVVDLLRAGLDRGVGDRTTEFDVSALILLSEAALCSSRPDLAEQSAELAAVGGGDLGWRDTMLARIADQQFESARAQALTAGGDPALLRSARDSLVAAIGHLRRALTRGDSNAAQRRDCERLLRKLLTFDAEQAGEDPQNPNDQRTSIDLGPEGGSEDPNGGRRTDEVDLAPGAGTLDSTDEVLRTLADKIRREAEEKRQLRRDAYRRRSANGRDW